MYCNNPSFDPDKYKVDFIKKDKILNLVPEEINDNCEKVINALDRALFFFQTRCGIRTIGEINYNLMLVLVGTLFMEDSYFYNYEVHRLLEAWYWSVVFSGEYDKDQNSHMISNLQNIVRCVSGTNRDLTWLNSISANVLKMTNFSDKDLLLMNKVNEDRYPKPVLRNFMCQYLLSGTYMDMFDENVVLCVSNSYEKKYYFNPDFDKLPDDVKNELKIMCVLFTEEVGGILDMEFDEEGNLLFKSSADEGDLLYDEIACGMLVKKYQYEKRELLESLEMFFKVFFLGME